MPKKLKLVGKLKEPFGIGRKKCAITALKPHSACTGRTVFSQLPAAVVRHKANDGVVYAI